MSDFISYDVQSQLNEDQILRVLEHVLPAFAWHRGLSDAQGPYIAGSSQNVQIDVWLGEQPIEISVSFRSAWPDEPDREYRKEALAKILATQLMPSLGKVIRTDVRA